MSRARVAPLAAPVVALGLALLALAGCSEPAADAGSTYPLADVVGPRIAALERALPELPPLAPAQPDLAERVDGLVSERRNAQGRWIGLTRDEVRSIGDVALPHLLSAFDAGDDERRAAVIDLVGALGSVRACEPLSAWLEPPHAAWVRANAAYQLGLCDQDVAVPALVKRLNYETDGAAVVWISASLARYGVFAGLDGLYALQRDAADEGVRALAAAELARMAEDAGAPDPSTLWAWWNRSGAPDLPRPEPSPRLRLAAWRWIDELSGAHFQLRGVDDARFILSHLPEWVVELLREALHERDVYTRVHVCQVLERMGPRAATAVPDLVAALDDAACAAGAAAALGRIAGPKGVPALIALLPPERPYDLRVAAARALGTTGAAEAIPALDALAAAPSEPLDLRQTAAQALVALGDGAGDRVTAFLVDCLGDPAADRAGAERALEAWLIATAERSGEQGAAREVLERWRALGEPVDGALDDSSDADRHAARHALVAERLDELVGAP